MEQLKKRSITPALTLMVLAPLLTEVLPGATRFSSLFVFPIEVFVWGGGCVLIRFVVRKHHLNWVSILLLAAALALAEECVIQQTSFAPLVIRLKGLTYARLFGVNYVYLLWAIVYESVFVVFLPVYLAELIFPARRGDTWLSKLGVVIVSLLFLIGSFLAWFTWTRIARPKFYHLSIYTAPPIAYITSTGIIVLLICLALGPVRKKIIQTSTTLKVPAGWVIASAGALWAILWYAMVLLGFGIAPHFPPAVAVGCGLILTAAVLFVVPRWTVNQQWQDIQQFMLIAGVMVGSMAVSFVGFLDTKGPDLYFKIIVNVIALILLILLGFKVRKRQLLSPADIKYS